MLTGDDTNKALQKVAISRNKLAVASLTVAFDTVALMQKINSAKTDEYKGGLAYLIVQSLMKKYRPMDRISKLDALVELDEIEMDSDEEPDEMFNKIATVKQQYQGSGMDEANYMNHVIQVAPDIYTDNITTIVGNKGDALTLADIQKTMNLKFPF